MEKLERYKWTSNNPDTYITPSYTYRRSGADMIYSIALLVEKPTGTFGFPIYLDLALDGVTKVSEYTIKAASPSSWTSYTYQSAEFTVKRKSSGSTSLKIRIYSGSGSSRDQTNYFNLFVSPAESKLTIDPNFKIGSPFTLSITKYDTSFIDSIELQLNNTTVLTRSPVFHGTVITPTKAETAKMYAQCPNSNHASAKLTLRTKDASGNSIGQSIRTGTAQVTNSNPTQAKFVVADINPKTLVLTGDNQKSIKGYSDLLVTITQAALAQNSASLKNYLVSCGTKQVVITPPQTAATITAAGAGNITVTAMDSRGNQTSSTMSLDMIAYQPVHITTAQAVRDNIADALTKLSYQGSYFSGSFGSIDNTIIKAQYSYKLTSADSYTDISNVDVMPVLDSEGKFHFGPEYIYGDLLANGFTAMSSFDIKLELSDRLTTVVYQVQLPAGVPGLFLKRTGNDYALGVGMIPTVKKGLQVDGSLVLRPG